MILCSNFVAFSFQSEVAGLLFNIFSYPKFWAVVIIGPLVALLPDISVKTVGYSSHPTPPEYINRYLSSLRSILFPKDSGLAMLDTPAARKAEKVLKQILKNARDLKLKRKDDSEEYPENNTLQCLVLNENKFNYLEQEGSIGLQTDEYKGHSDEKDSDSNINGVVRINTFAINNNSDCEQYQNVIIKDKASGISQNLERQSGKVSFSILSDSDQESKDDDEKVVVDRFKKNLMEAYLENEKDPDLLAFEEGEIEVKNSKKFQTMSKLIDEYEKLASRGYTSKSDKRIKKISPAEKNNEVFAPSFTKD